MDTLYYDAITHIFDYLDLQDLANLLNCNNKYIYETLMNYIKQKKIYKDIIRYDSDRFERFSNIFYTDFLQYGSKFRELIFDDISTMIICQPILEATRLGCSLQVLKHIKDNVYYVDDILSIIIFNENIHIDNTENMNWLKANGATVKQSYFIDAAGIGNIKTLKWLVDNTWCPFDYYSIFEAAAINGDLENMKWLKEKGFKWNARTFTGAALNGNLDNMKWLKENDCPFDQYGKTFENAAVNGIIENMIWLLENDVTVSEISFSFAAQLGNLEIMKWMKEIGFPLSEYVFVAAIMNCDMEINPLPIFIHPHSGVNLFNRSNSTIEILEWLKSNNCPMSKYAYIEARRRENVEIIKWLKDNDCPE